MGACISAFKNITLYKDRKYLVQAEVQMKVVLTRLLFICGVQFAQSLK